MDRSTERDETKQRVDERKRGHEELAKEEREQRVCVYS